MLVLRVVEHLDIVEHVLPCGFSGQVCAATDAFPLQELEEAFGYCVVVTVSAAAHAGFQIVLAKEHLPLAAGELRSLVGVDHHLARPRTVIYAAKQTLGAIRRLVLTCYDRNFTLIPWIKFHGY